MILAEQEGRLRVVTQNDHAHFAAELLSLWRTDGLPENPRRQEILLAAREHDNGWREADSAPHRDPESGRPLDFTSVPLDLRREIWRRGVRRLPDSEIWARLLILQHAIHLHRARSDSAKWATLLDEWRQLRDEVLESSDSERSMLDDDYRWVELTDLLSLALCSRWQRDFELYGFRIGARDSTLRIAPFPFAGATTFRVPCRAIPDRRYAGDADLGSELAGARWQRCSFRIEAFRSTVGSGEAVRL